MELQVYVEFNKGQLSPESDPSQFEQEITAYLEKYADAYGIKFDLEKSPPPDDALGVEEYMSFVLENIQVIIDQGKDLITIVRAVSGLSELFLKGKKDDEGVTAYIQVGDKKLPLPAKIKEINDFVKENNLATDSNDEEE